MMRQQQLLVFTRHHRSADMGLPLGGLELEKMGWSSLILTVVAVLGSLEAEINIEIELELGAVGRLVVGWT